MILTDQEKMVLTPTYHVFHMYKPFRGARQLPVELAAPARVSGDLTVPTVTASAARDAQGRLHVALVNLDPQAPIDLQVKIAGATPKPVTGRLLTAPAIDTVNTFAKPEAVKPVAFNGARAHSGGIRVVVPARSVLVLSEVPQ
jgi:alpha-N-arabinofuranosidase